MNAPTTSPHRSSGRPTTATSATAGMAVEDLFDLCGKQILAAADDHVLESTDDSAVAALVHVGEVACAQPAVGGSVFAVASGMSK